MLPLVVVEELWAIELVLLVPFANCPLVAPPPDEVDSCWLDNEEPEAAVEDETDDDDWEAEEREESDARTELVDAEDST